MSSGAAASTAMGELLPYRPRKSREDTTAWLGMVFFLASWAMMFAALFFSYAYVRAASRAFGWPPEDMPPLPVVLPALATSLIVLSSAVLQYGTWAVKRGHTGRLAPAWVLAIVLGTLFLAVQLWTWTSLYRQGLTVRDGGAYASVFYGLTGLHAVHVLVGLFGLGWIVRRALGGAYGPGRHLGVRLWGMYWHFVGGVWALMFVSVFLM